jgi:hypothetical protein
MGDWLKNWCTCALPPALLSFAVILVYPFATATRSINDEVPLVIARTSSPARLEETAVWVPLNEAAEAGKTLTPDMLRQWVPKRRLSLILKDISADAQPASPFAVYLGLAPSASPAEQDPHYVGKFWFYNEINSGALKATPSVRTFDITSLVRHLLKAHAFANPVGVMIVPERMPLRDANAAVGSIAIVAQ